MGRGALALLLVGCGPAAVDTSPVRVLGSSSTGTGASTTRTDCARAGFEQPTAGLEGAALWEALGQLTAAHHCAGSYTEETIFLFTRLDKQNGEVEGVYTGRRTPVGNAKPPEDDMNTEHTWPQSQGAGTDPARCDLHHLYPADATANAQRGSWPFGRVTGAITWTEGGSSLGQDAGGATVFEPRDVHKGNVARSMLYFAARYGYTLSPSEIALYQDWHALDPVDARELERTWTIADRQGVPNPLVVCPDRVDRL